MNQKILFHATKDPVQDLKLNSFLPLMILMVEKGESPVKPKSVVIFVVIATVKNLNLKPIKIPSLFNL